jgi:nucleotide-binding universal stress UspA family protein
MNSSIRSLLVHLDSGPETAARLGDAHALAAACGASSITACYAVPTLLPNVSWEAAASAVEILAEAELDAQQQVRARFDAATASMPNQPQWMQSSGLSTAEWLAEATLWHDLLLLHRPRVDTAGALPAEFFSTVALQSAAPVMVLPQGSPLPVPGGVVAVAWKPSRQASMAVRSALPWLRAARQVKLLVCGGDALTTTPELIRWLDRHSVPAQVQAVARQGQAVGPALLEAAQDAGMLVMGAWGHSRALEWVLGGVTRSVLTQSTLPLWLLH